MVPKYRHQLPLAEAWSTCPAYPHGVDARSSLRYGTPAARWVLLATVLGSGIAFLDSTVVNVALPTIGREFDAGVSGLQWTVDAYLLTLASFLLPGGSLGDVFGRRRVFVTGLVAFSVASALAGAAPTIAWLIGARAFQGAAGALLVPSSLALISACFEESDRGKAIGAWSGLSGVTTAIGPFLGGYLVDSVSWRLIFFINIPLAALAVAVAAARIPGGRGDVPPRRIDVPGTLVVAPALGSIVYALIEGPGRGWSEPSVVVAGVIGTFLVGAFAVVERAQDDPMLPFSIFRSRQFSAANGATLVVYFALGGALFFLVIQLQSELGYSALEAGASLAPITVLLLVLSPPAGALAGRIGPRLPMSVGPLVVAGGLALLARVGPGSSYIGAILPGILIFGIGLGITVAPLTTAVLGGIEPDRVGLASGINNAAARVAGLLAVALLPLVAGVAGARPVSGAGFAEGFDQAMWVAAAASALGGALSFAFVRRPRPTRLALPPSLDRLCEDTGSQADAASLL